MKMRLHRDAYDYTGIFGKGGDEACKWLLRKYGDTDELESLLQMVAFSASEACIQRDKLAHEIDRQKLKDELFDAMDLSGKVTVDVWSRDCDGVSGSYPVEIEPTLEAWDKLADSCEANAEGPWSMRIIPLEQMAEYEPQPTRDHTLEAFEDGHPHVLYV